MGGDTPSATTSSGRGRLCPADCIGFSPRATLLSRFFFEQKGSLTFYATLVKHISKAADSRKTQAEGALAKAGSAASESVKAQRRAIAAAANAHAAKLSAEDATNILTGAKEGASAAQKDATRALGEMASAKSKLLRGMFKNAVSRVAQKVSIDKKVADCTQKCTAILDAIEGAEPYTMNVLRAVSLGFGVQGGN